MEDAQVCAGEVRVELMPLDQRQHRAAKTTRLSVLAVRFTVPRQYSMTRSQYVASWFQVKTVRFLRVVHTHILFRFLHNPRCNWS